MIGRNRLVRFEARDDLHISIDVAKVIWRPSRADGALSRIKIFVVSAFFLGTYADPPYGKTSLFHGLNIGYRGIGRCPLDQGRLEVSQRETQNPTRLKGNSQG
jgi:hypothetical protein